MRKIVYLFGTGAGYGTIPLVKKMGMAIYTCIDSISGFLSLWKKSAALNDKYHKISGFI